MNKLAFATVALSLLVAAPVLAQTERQEDVAADVNAIHKDDAALAKHHGNMKKHRAKKAAAKANGDVAAQAGASAELGADHVMVGEKNAEKNVDKKILEHDDSK